MANRLGVGLSELFELADEGEVLINEIVKRLDMKTITEEMRSLEAFEQDVMKRYPWIPASGGQRR